MSLSIKVCTRFNLIAEGGGVDRGGGNQACVLEEWKA